MGNKVKVLIKRPDQVDFDELEKRTPKIQNTTVVIFPSLELAIHMATRFVHQDLIPRLGSKEEAVKFPLIKSGPARPADDVFSEILEIKKPPVEEETWFLIGNARFPEFYNYLTKKYLIDNPQIEVQDLRQ